MSQSRKDRQAGHTQKQLIATCLSLAKCAKVLILREGQTYYWLTGATVAQEFQITNGDKVLPETINFHLM